MEQQRVVEPGVRMRADLKLRMCPGRDRRWRRLAVNEARGGVWVCVGQRRKRRNLWRRCVVRSGRLCFGCEPSRCRRAQAGVDHGRAVRYFE